VVFLVDNLQALKTSLCCLVYDDICVVFAVYYVCNFNKHCVSSAACEFCFSSKL